MLHDQQGWFPITLVLLGNSLNPSHWKFWNVKVVSRRPTSGAVQDPNAEPPHVEEERRESAATLKEKQIRMEQQVYRIWT
jgi:hypothetical protein